MANIGVVDDDENQMDLPPGFRFHPTDEELISQYLYKKVVDINFRARAIGEVDLNKSEPWELPWKGKMGEKEWYFFCVRDRKYPTGLRTNRATDSGYWKATGKDKEIYRGKSLVGLKKTLVFYKGRAPKGEKTNWVMHEYKLDGRFSVQNLPKTAKNEWVICRVFQKTSDGKKAHISGLIRVGSFGNELGPSRLPPLMESSSPYNDNCKPVAESAYVPCFSNPIDLQRKHEETIDTFNPLLLLPVSSNPTSIFPRISVSNSFHSPQRVPVPSNFQLPGFVSMQMQDQSIRRAMIHNHGSSNMRQDFKIEREMVNFSQETGLTTDINPKISSLVSNLEIGNRAYHDQGPPSTSAVPVNLDCFWHC